MRQKPDILLILTDQWNPRMLGCYGDDQVQTPNIGPAPIPPEDHPDSNVAQHALEAIDACPEGKPLNLCVSFPGPHSPFDAPGEYATMFDPQDMVLPPNVPETTRQGEHRYDRDHIRRAQANYYGKIKLIDDWIGKIVAKLKERGNWDRTLVIFTADHGENLGTHGRFFKGTFNDESVRVPLILRWPGHIPEDAATDALAQLIDINPTLVEAAGGRQSPQKFGRSIMPVATRREERIHDCVFSEIGDSGLRNYMVRDPRYKWYRLRGEEHLYDMHDDPYELCNLIDDPKHRDDALRLRARLGQFLMESQVNFADTYVSLFGRIQKQFEPGETIGSMLRKQFAQIQLDGDGPFHAHQFILRCASGTIHEPLLTYGCQLICHRLRLSSPQLHVRFARIQPIDAAGEWDYLDPIQKLICRVVTDNDCRSSLSDLAANRWVEIYPPDLTSLHREYPYKLPLPTPVPPPLGPYLQPSSHKLRKVPVELHEDVPIPR